MMDTACFIPEVDLESERSAAAMLPPTMSGSGGTRVNQSLSEQGLDSAKIPVRL
jgi:hypothetical protein